MKRLFRNHEIAFEFLDLIESMASYDTTSSRDHIINKLDRAFVVKVVINTKSLVAIIK